MEDATSNISPMVTLTNCCNQSLHLECYLKSLPKCPFCRVDQPQVPERIIVVQQNEYTHWARVVRTVSMFTLVCASISVITLFSSSRPPTQC